jgi:hypothetical protein
VAWDTTINLSRGKLDFAEEQRVRRMTYDKFDLWFDTWEKELLRYGLAVINVPGRPHIPLNKLHQILNFDETSLSTDGNLINRGGWPAAYWFNPRLPQVGIVMSKMSQCCWRWARNAPM